MQKTVILDQPGQLRFTHTEEPARPEPGGALVRVRRIGVCGTDLHAFQGNQPFFSYPRILGHELGVEVLAVGENERGLTVGTKCAVEPYLHCGHCPACLRGRTNCCVNLQVLGVHIDGGMREVISVPLEYLHPSSILSFDHLALVEPLAIGAHAVSRALLSTNERVAVVGAGPIGLAVTQFALLAGAQVTVMDVSEPRLQLCQEFFPRAICLSGSGNFLASLRDRFGDDLPTAVFDATGNPHSMQAAFSYAGHGGRIIFVGLFQGDITFNDPDLHRRELTLLSSRNALAADFQRIIAYMEQDRVAIAPWITHRATAETVVEAFPQWLDRNSGIVKALITM